MSTRHKRAPRRPANPLMLLAGRQPIGRDDADRLVLPSLAHLSEVAGGHGNQQSMQILTVSLAAAYDAALHYNNPRLQALFEAAGLAWVAAGARCKARGVTGRIVLTGDELGKLRAAIAALCDWLPRLEIGVWVGLINDARARWNWHCQRQAAA